MTRPATDMTDVQLAYVTDMGMLEPTVVSMMSALEGTRSPVAIHLFGHNLTDDAMALLDMAVRGFPQARLHFREVTQDMVAGKEAEDVQYPPTVMAALHLPRILAGGGGRVLYLDGDTIVHGDVSDLFGIDLEGCHVGAVRDYGGQLGHSREIPTGAQDRIRARNEGLMHPHALSDTFNSGVVLFDIDSIGSIPGFAERITDCLGIDNDQPPLNHHMRGRVFYLNPSWNAYAGIYHLYRRIDIAMIGSGYRHNPPRITHFVGLVKPWHDFSVDGLMADLQETKTRMCRSLGLDPQRDTERLFPKLTDAMIVQEYADTVRRYRKTFDRLIATARRL